tara:strand:- start:199 stop:651 length:453 start_codon:yes stop_codon:yes gene_type:complete
MDYMFNHCNAMVSLNVSNFDTSLVNNTYSMFGNCSDLTGLDLSSFDTSSVNTMGYMFYNCLDLVEIIGVEQFDIESLNSSSSLSNFATNVNLNTNRYDSLLVAWDAQNVRSSMSIRFGTGTKYTSGSAAETARNNLITGDLWTIIDGGAV